MLQARGLWKSYGIQPILEDVTFTLQAGERAGLIGPNGCGKSTLLRILAGEEGPEQGTVALAGGVTVGYLAQGMAYANGLTVGAAAWGGTYDAARTALHQIEDELSRTNALDAALAAYDAAREQFEVLGGYEVEQRASEVLAHLGLAGLDLDAPVGRLSGGQQTRLGLASLLIGAPDVLLLDEPTNHLDIEALEWLEGFLARYRGAALIVSHDRVFLDHTVTRILELDATTHRLTEYPGGYGDYAAAKEHEWALQRAAWADQEAEIRRLRRDIARTKEQARHVERTTTPREPGVRRYAKKVAKKALAREKKLDRYLGSEERVERPRSAWRMKLDFGEMLRGGQEAIRLEGLGHRFDDATWLFRDATLTLRHGERIAVLGPNGCGKSTLLRCIVGEIAPAEGSVQIGAGVRIGFLPQGQDALDPADTPLDVILHTRAMSETDARSLLHFFLFAGDDVFVPVQSLSYGQRARLLLARIVVAGANCLILDEPLNHLDIPARERFEQALSAFPGPVLVTGHDRAFIDRFATGVWEVGEGMVHPYVDREEMLRARSAIQS